MKLKFIALSFGLLLCASVVSVAQDPNMGTWKLNEAKSKLASPAKNTTVIYEPAGDMIKVIVDGVDADGNATHNEWTGKFDEQYYAVTGDPTSDMRAYKRINSRTLSLTAKKGDEVTLTGKIVVSKDGRSRTITTSGTDAKGMKFTNTALYDKQ
jgi:hypothetical protein